MFGPLGHGIGQTIGPEVDIIIHLHDVISIEHGGDELEEHQGFCCQTCIGLLQSIGSSRAASVSSSTIFTLCYGKANVKCD